jgi:hypothetical protein
MKYKNIKAMLHNFGHSFFSLMNYVDGEYIIDIIAELVREAEGNEIRISFPSGEITPKGKYPIRLKKSIGFHNDWLMKHADHHAIDLKSISDIQLTATGSILGIIYSVQAKDDRGKEYDIPIQQT